MRFRPVSAARGITAGSATKRHPASPMLACHGTPCVQREGRLGEWTLLQTGREPPQRASGVRDGAGVQTWPGGAGVTELKETGAGGDGVGIFTTRAYRFYLHIQASVTLDEFLGCDRLGFVSSVSERCKVSIFCNDIIRVRRDSTISEGVIIRVFSNHMKLIMWTD